MSNKLVIIAAVAVAALAAAGAVFYAFGGSENPGTADFITYELDGGTNDPANIANPSGTLVLKDPSKTGYAFGGWYSDSSHTIRITQIEPSNGNVTVYAMWTANTYTVTFDANGGTLAGDASATATYDAPLSTPDAFKAGHVFAGWNTQADGKGTVFASDDVWKFTSDTTLYALWTTNTYTVTFDANGGNLIGDSSVEIVYGMTFTFSQSASRNGYTFKEWNTQADGNGTAFVSGDTWKFTSDTALYAQWTANTYTVTFDANGGSLTGDRTATATYDAVFKFDTGATLSEYHLTGWFTDRNEGYEVKNGEKWTIASDITLFAHWRDKCTITYDLNDPYGMARSVVASSEVQYGASAHLDPQAIRPLFKLTGWCLDPECQGTVYTDIEQVTSDITVYAKWEPVTGLECDFSGSCDISEDGIQLHCEVNKMMKYAMYDLDKGFLGSVKTIMTFTYSSGYEINMFTYMSYWAPFGYSGCTYSIEEEEIDGAMINVLVEAYGTEFSYTYLPDGSLYKMMVAMDSTETYLVRTDAKQFTPQTTCTVNITSGPGITNVTGAGTYNIGDKVTLGCDQSDDANWQFTGLDYTISMVSIDAICEDIDLSVVLSTTQPLPTNEENTQICDVADIGRNTGRICNKYLSAIA